MRFVISIDIVAALMILGLAALRRCLGTKDVLESALTGDQLPIVGGRLGIAGRAHCRAASSGQSRQPGVPIRRGSRPGGKHSGGKHSGCSRSPHP